MKIKKTLLCLSALSLLLCSCGSKDENYCNNDLTNASSKLKTVIKQVEDDRLNVFSVTEISKKGTSSKCFEAKEDIHNIYSLSKNFTSMAMGTLISEGKADVTKSIYDYFSSDYPNMDVKWKECTLGNVMTQTTGITSGFLDVDQDDVASFGDDYLKTALDHVPTETPGTYFQYSDSNYYIVSSVIKKITGNNSQELIKEKIFKPLNITHYDFVTDTKGNFMGATGLYLTSPEVAKFGYMLLKGGKYNDVQVIDADYVAKATSQIVETDDNGTFYGYSIWSNVGYKNIFYGNGMLGQYMVCDLNRQVVTAIISEESVSVVDELFDTLAN